MAISNLLPAGGANDNRPNLKQFFGKNPAVANDNAERVSGGMFSNSFVDSVVTTLHSLVEEIAKITDIAKSVIASLGAVVKSLKNLNKDITTRFRVLNNEMNASRIDFIRTVLAIPKTDVPVKIDGVPVNVNAPQEEPKKEDDKENFFKDLFEKLILGWITKNLGSTALNMLKSLLGVAETLLRLAGSIALDLVGKLPALFRLLSGFVATPAVAGLLAGAVLAMLLYHGLKEMTKAIMEQPEFQSLMERDKDKSEQQMQDEAAKNIAVKLGGGNRKKASPEQLIKGNKWGDGGQELKASAFTKILNTDIDPSKGERIAVLENPLADGTKAINIDTGEKYGVFDMASSVGNVKAGGIIGAPAAPAGAPSSIPMPTGAPTTASPSALGTTGAGAFGLGGATGTNAAPAPTGAPAGEVKQESNAPAPPPSGAPAGTATATSVAAPPAGPSGGSGAGAGGGVAVVQNSSVQNVGSTAGAETGGMTGQNLPMFARNPKLQESFGRQTVKYQ
jgi:hypothetical protein